MIRSDHPIGIFDSGVGGLTVAKAVKELLPNESIVYFGDTAHLPYGDKSVAAIQAYSVRIVEMLLQHKCKVILMACNSASAVAYDLVIEYVGGKTKVLDVINPTIDYVRENYQSEIIGLIGTKRTVSSGVYAQKIKELNQGIELKSLATPLLVPMIEEGIYNDKISREIIARYLDNPVLSTIKSLILGCTHYPIIKESIQHHLGLNTRKVAIIDSAEIAAHTLEAFLTYNQLINKGNTAEDKFLISDFTKEFELIAKTFFGEEIHLEKIPIWNELN